MLLAFTGASTFSQALNLTRSDPSCHGSPLTCTIDLNVPAGSYSVNISAYDRAPVDGSIPNSAKLLSSASNQQLTVIAGTDNSKLSVTLGGVPSAIAISSVPSATVGSAFATPAPLTVIVKDADGYTIVGTYATAVQLGDSDTSGATRIDGATLLESTDAATLSYDGTGILPATISAAAGIAASGNATFAPRFALSAAGGKTGTSVQETISGAGFVDGTTTVSVGGTGVTVTDVAVSSSTSLTASFFIDPGATAASHDVTVTTPPGSGNAAQSFTVSDGNVDVVTLNSDDSLGTTPGICPAGTSGDLRNALCNAAAGDTIVFDTTSMCGSAQCTITLGAPLPPIQQNQTIDGGSFGRVIVDGNGAYRVFWVDGGTVSLANLQIQNAVAQGGAGAAANGSTGSGGGGAGLGAGLFVNSAAAVVAVTNDYFVHDSAVGGTGGGYDSGSADGGGGGGGLDGNGAEASQPPPYSEDSGGGGGGILTAGSSYNGGLGGGGGGGGHSGGFVGGSGGGAYAGNSAGNPGGSTSPSSFNGGGGGIGGFGGGGGGGAYGDNLAGNGGTGGFGGGGGGGSDAGSIYSHSGAGGAGGGGGGATAYGAGQGPGLGGTLATISGGSGASGVGYGGGGAAAGPAIFVNAGSVTTSNSGAAEVSATAGGSGGSDAGAGGSDATPVFNFNGTVNASSTTGGVAGALLDEAPALRRAHRSRHREPPKR
jgi:hypothetical protein